jgi:hypothetical protein
LPPFVVVSALVSVALAELANTKASPQAAKHCHFPPGVKASRNASLLSFFGKILPLLSEKNHADSDHGCNYYLTNYCNKRLTINCNEFYSRQN